MIRLVTLLFLVLLSVSQAMAGAVGGGDLVIVDRDGKEVGGVFDVARSNYFYATVVNEITSGNFIKINVWRSRLMGEDAVFFAEENCQGQAYFFSPGYLHDDSPVESIFAWSGIAPPGHTVYVADKDQAVVPRAPLSVFDSSLGCIPQEWIATDSMDMVSAYPVGTLEVSPPFALSRKGIIPKSCCGDCNGDGEVKINEVVSTVSRSLEGCPASSSP